MSGEVAAAWVQAVGTLIAIAVAIAAPIINQRVNERAHQRRLVTAMAAIANSAAGLLNQAAHLCETQDKAFDYAERFSGSHWDYIKRGLAAFPLHATNDFQLAFAVLEIESLLDYAEGIIVDARAQRDKKLRHTLLQEIKPVAAVITDHAKKLDEARELKTPWWRVPQGVKDIWDK